jgi:molybdenum cofactor cytidylyltransferase
MKTAAIILAAGESQRMGRPKQLLPVHSKPMLLHVVETVLSARLDQVIVVLGASAATIQPVLAATNVTIAINDDWREGLASSLRAGLERVSPRAEAALFVPADLPRLTTRTIQAIIACRKPSGKSIVIPTCRGCRGNPVLFARSLFPELLGLHGDQGGRALFASHQADIELVEVGDEGILLDVDTPADYKQATLSAQIDGNKEDV